MAITLNQILELVGKLDDATGNDTPRERFRRFLRENVRDIGQIGIERAGKACCSESVRP